MVGAARGLIAEPDLVRNAFEGREERSRTCIACNWCMAGIHDSSAGCASIRSAIASAPGGRTRSRRRRIASKVIVVGAGPGGLEAARTCALRGHQVTLIEARARVGGAFALWAGLPGRDAYQLAIDWWERELERLGVIIRLRTRATAAEILAEKPDAVMLATGAAYHRGGRGFYSEQDIPGYDRDFVYRPEEILSLSVLPRGQVLVQDDEGLQTGMGIAELLAKNGADVEFLTPNFLPLSSRIMAAQEGRPMVQRLRALGGRISTMSFIKEIRDSRSARRRRAFRRSANGRGRRRGGADHRARARE